MTLMIAMPGPPLPEKGSGASARDALPELPHLTRLLGAARRLPSAPGWRAGVLAAFDDRATDWPLVAVAARGLPAIAAGTALCLAAPLHVVAGISRVHLPPQDLLDLTEAEREVWRVAFNQEFGGADVHLHAVPGGWLLAAPAAAGARDAAPSDLLGAALERQPAQGDAERRLRLLGAEVEMWLAAHPLNAAREARRLPPVNCFWFWAGAQARELPRLARPPRSIHGPVRPDPWLAGLARHSGLDGVQVAEGWHAVRTLNSGLIVPALDDDGAARAHWERLETQWFEPMEQARRAGELPALRLQVGATGWQLPDVSPLRWLRRRQSWHEALRA